MESIAQLKNKLIVFLLLLNFVAFAQDTTTYKSSDVKPFKRTDYIEDLSNMINISPMIFQTRSTFTLKGKEGVDYSPNDGYNVGLKLQHKWLGFAFSYSPKKLQEDKKGTSAFTNLVLNSYGRKVGFDVYYLEYKGYYVQNYRSFPALDSSVSGGKFPQRSDLQTLSVGFNLYYIFNSKKFSYRAAFANNDWQKKSASSFTLTTSFNYYEITADSTILIRKLDNNAHEETKLVRGGFYSIGLMPGYAFTLVLSKHFFFTFTPAVGGMFQIQNYYTEHNKQVSRQVFIPRYLARLGIGYSGSRFYAGFTSIGDAYSIPLAKNESLNYTIGNVTLYAGIRLPVPKILKKPSDFLGKCNPGNIFLLFNKN